MYQFPFLFQNEQTIIDSAFYDFIISLARIYIVEIGLMLRLFTSPISLRLELSICSYSELQDARKLKLSMPICKIKRLSKFYYWKRPRIL